MRDARPRAKTRAIGRGKTGLGTIFRPSGALPPVSKNHCASGPAEPELQTVRKMPALGLSVDARQYSVT
jgi:hypothetical protein